MICYLIVTGRDFDPAKFLRKISLAESSEVWLRGQPIRLKATRRRLRRKTLSVSGFHVAASQPGPDTSIDRQVTQAIQFLRKHRRDLQRLRRTPGVESKTLRFGMIWPDKAGAIGRVLPRELLQIAAQCGLDIEFAVYGATAWKPLRK
jgi:hypothetical protein